MRCAVSDVQLMNARKYVQYTEKSCKKILLSVACTRWPILFLNIFFRLSVCAIIAKFHSAADTEKSGRGQFARPEQKNS